VFICQRKVETCFFFALTILMNYCQIPRMVFGIVERFMMGTQYLVEDQQIPRSVVVIICGSECGPALTAYSILTNPNR
jgi:hypothetical protein